ncbi:hypothetical protein JYT82_00635 [bacterium AH-315-K20]|nr:hypothetical protein [bacterium AH-315-K20]
MIEVDPESLFNGTLEDITARYKSTDRLAVVVLQVDQAELRGAGSRSQQLILQGVPIYVAAGPAPLRVAAQFYYSDTAVPDAGDTVIAILAGSIEGEEQIWMIESFVAVASSTAAETANQVAARMRALMAADPFGPFAEP